MAMNPVVHFEMPAVDRKRMSEFYTKVFGWKTKQMGEEMGNYVVVQTTETDENNMVKTPGNINGGFYQKTETNNELQYPSIVISVDDLDAAIEKVKAAGGKLSGNPEDIPGIGRWASIIDSEGNRISILQPKMQ